MLELNSAFRAHFSGDEAEVFDRIMALDGEVFRCLAGRKTLRFVLDGKGYFAKLHFGVGWREIVKNLLMMRRPVLGARDEWLAIHRLGELRIATMAIAGFGERGWLPSHQQSFLITDELRNTTSLEDYCRDWPTVPPPVALKRALIEKVAKIAGALHNHGVNHRDFYICHFLLDTSSVRAPYEAAGINLYLIDLHRVQRRAVTPQRWIEKDVAALHFSSMKIGLTTRDRLRFMKTYRDRALRNILTDERSFWEKVERKAQQLCAKPEKD